jgi:hypothetical protein
LIFQVSADRERAANLAAFFFFPGKSRGVRSMLKMLVYMRVLEGGYAFSLIMTGVSRLSTI